MITNIRQTSIQSHFPYSSPELRRIFSLDNYRFGFNGKENDNEVKGTGNQQDYGMRIYDPRLGRFLSADPLIVQEQKYPELTPYQFASNTPIQAIDLDGLEGLIVVKIVDKPKNFNSKVFCQDVQRRLIENGAHPGTRVVVEGSTEYDEIGWWGRQNDFFSNQSATITVRNYNMALDRGNVDLSNGKDPGGYGGDNEIVLFTGGSTKPELRNRALSSSKWAWAALHEIGHAVYNFKHDDAGNTADGTDMMDYNTQNNPNTQFSKAQQIVIKTFAKSSGNLGDEGKKKKPLPNIPLKGKN